jgi:hypothetical protein
MSQSPRVDTLLSIATVLEATGRYKVCVWEVNRT